MPSTFYAGCCPAMSNLEPYGSPAVVIETDREMPHEDYFGAKVLMCHKCGGSSFEVAKGDYVTLVQCTICRIPSCVHDG